MPGGDKTGPSGGGPKTGRGLGYCADNDQPGYASIQPTGGLGRGFRRGGRGGGRGFGNGRARGWRNRLNTGFGARQSRRGFAVNDQEVEMLKAETQELRDTLQQILDKLNKLDS